MFRRRSRWKSWPAGLGRVKPHFRRVLRLEPLEERCLLAAMPTLLSLSAPATALVGQPLELTASVTVPGSTSAAPSGGTVTFRDGNVLLGTTPVVNGQASLVNSVFTTGVGTLTASYSGSPTAWAGSSSAGQDLLVSSAAGNASAASSFSMPYFVCDSSTGASPADNVVSPWITPAMIRQAYGFSSVAFGSHPADGTGTTIAIVDAYDDPNIASDLAAFDSTFGLAAPPSFSKVNQTGGSSLPAPAALGGWGIEMSLDVEWAHAVAPGANILLVEANSDSNNDLYAAVNYARQAAGVVAVSMSWGVQGEFAGETADDSYFFTTPGGHAGVTFVAASGDNGAPASYPATSPNVLSVGGTSLTFNGSSYAAESGWSGAYSSGPASSGGGLSSYESQPPYQNGVVTQSTTMRTSPDVAYDANALDGYWVCDSYDGGKTPWTGVGGTSAGTPQWAALVAIADQGRALAGLSALDGPSQTLPLLYGLPAGDFHDVTTGGSVGTPPYWCGPGYDLVTGLGSPQADLLIPALASESLTSTSLSASASAVTAGQAVTLTATVAAASSGAGTPGGGTVTFYDYGTVIGSATLVGGAAAMTTTTLTDGLHQLTASYGGYASTFWPSKTGGTTSVSVIATVAGDGAGDGLPASAALLNYPTGAALDSAGDLFIPDTADQRVREVNHLTGVITTVAGNGTDGYNGDGGQATAAELNAPWAVALDAFGNLFIVDSGNERIREVNLATGVITTVAGNGSAAYGGDGGQATAARLDDPVGLALDSSGDLYIADSGNERIREVNLAAGVITTVAGNGSAAYGGDGGQATAAMLDEPEGVAVDSSGDLYIADYANHRVRKVVLATGVIATVAGNGSSGYSGDGSLATAAMLSDPDGVAVDGGGNVYIADQLNDRIRELNVSTGIIVTVAGNGSGGYSGDGGAATAAALYYPRGLAVDSSANLYIADVDNNRIRLVNRSTGLIGTFAGGPGGSGAAATAATLDDPTGEALDSAGDIFAADAAANVVTEINHATGLQSFIAGTGLAGFGGDGGPATAARLTNPRAVAVDSAGNVYIADTNDERVREINHATGVITTVAGNGIAGYNGDSIQATAAELFYPDGLVLDGKGDLFISDENNNRIREVNLATGIITTVAGGGVGDGQPATVAALDEAQGVAVDSAGNVFIADTYDNRVREINHATGLITTVAGNGAQGYNGDNIQGTAAALNYPDAVAVDSSGNLYIADTNNSRIRKVNLSTGVITTVAGNGSFGYNGDGGQATAAWLDDPQGVALDGKGDLFICDENNNRIRKVNLSTGVISTVAGNGTSGFSGDGSAATAAKISRPWGIAADSAGNVYFADNSNSRIREVNAATGVISTVAGNGTQGYSGDGGAATAAELDNPAEVAVDAAGDVFIADNLDNRVREVNVATGVIATVAGNGTAGFGGDGGPATAAKLDNPRGVALDAAGNLYIADSLNDRLREVNFSAGTISTVAGNGSVRYLGDGAAATAAGLNGPTGLAMDAAGNLYVADTQNQRVREIAAASGLIATVAGTGMGGSGGDGGAATAAQLNMPEGVAVDAGGNVYIADYFNNRVRVANAATGVISTLAGDGTLGYGGDGAAPTTALLDMPTDVALDASGNLYITDTGNNRIREVSPQTVVLPGTVTMTVNPASASATSIACSSAAADYGGTAALSATLLCGGTPVCGQSITFALHGFTLGTALTNAAGVATLSAARMAGYVPGTYSGYLAASFAGSTYFQASSAAAGLVVSPAPLTVTANNAAKLYGATDPAFTVTGAGFAPGEGLANLGGTLVFTTSQPAGGFAAPGSYSIVPGGLTSANYAIAFASGTLAVTPALTVTSLRASAASCVYGQSLTLTATVAAAAPSAATPTGGTVTFMNGAVALGSATLTAGTAVWTGAALPTGSYQVSAVYSGDGLNFLGNSAANLSAAAMATAAGFGVGDGQPATAATLDKAYEIAVDNAGNLFIADTGDERIREVNHLTGVITTVAGNGVLGYSGDGGQATAAELNYPAAIAVDASGRLFIADAFNERIREVNLATGVITTVAGDGTAGFSGDGGQATAAELAAPQALAVDGNGHLFIADSSNNCIREVTFSTGLISTVAGAETAGYSGDGGPATAAQLNYPRSLALDGRGNLFIADYNNQRVRQLNLSTGVITTAAGDGTYGFSGDGGPATAAMLDEPGGVSVDAAGDLLIADNLNKRVREVNAATGLITTIAGNGTAGISGDGGPATAADLQPADMALDAAGDLYILDFSENRVRLVNAATGVISTVAGGYAGNNVAATAGPTVDPHAVAIDAAGDLFIADYGDDIVREVNAATGLMTIVAGSGAWPYGGDGGPATAAGMSELNGVAVDSSGNLFIADTDDGRVREVNLATGIITTVAGSGFGGYSGDGGPATAATFNRIVAVAVDNKGHLFIGDEGNNCIREVNLATGIITTVAGDGGHGYSGDGGPATAAELSSPVGIAADGSGNLFISDQDNNRIRKVNLATGVITTIAGDGGGGYNGDGQQATAAMLYSPQGIAVDAYGDLFVADIDNARVREVNLRTGVISTIAGTGVQAYAGDGGAATAAELSSPYGVAVTADGRLFIADSGDNRVRAVLPPTLSLAVSQALPAVSLTTSQNAVVCGQSVTFTAVVSSGAGTPTGTVTFEDGGVPLVGGSTVTLAGGTVSFSISTLALGSHTITAVYSGDSNDTAGTSAAVSQSVVANATVVGRDLFYADSSYNGKSETASAADDNAIDGSKSALLPGQTATYANYTDSTQGINGIMVDVAGLANPAGLTAADFQFLVGNDSTPSDWTTLAAAPSVTVRAGAGTDGSDRVELIWPDNAIHNQWLQVTVLADANTGLATPDVFYFGSEPGAVQGAGYASFDDIFAVYRAIGNTPNVAPGTAADVNHDGMITFDDIFAVYRAIGNPELTMITTPATPATMTAATTVADTGTSAATVAANATAPADTGSPAAESAAGSSAVGSAVTGPAVTAAAPVMAAPRMARRVAAAPAPIKPAVVAQEAPTRAAPVAQPSMSAAAAIPPAGRPAAPAFTPADVALLAGRPLFSRLAAQPPLLPFDVALAQTQDWGWTDPAADNSWPMG